ncbi:MAG TPA: bifunctional DNA primase/polymerase [Verrucomicrobiota bacterium]|nr:bifunctional DNA primase/polymerase [Verrucomicrobiota bacterium]
MLSDPLLRSALDHANRGWPVFPLRPGDKRPAIRDWETRATTDLDRIHRAWTAGPYNIGVACGPARLVVIDLDSPKPGSEIPARWRRPGIVNGANVFALLAGDAGERLPIQTYSVSTAGGGGQHLYFSTSPDGPKLRNTAGRLGWLIDTRATGGYVVGVGSRITGRSYRPILDLPVAPLPGWISALLANDDRQPAPTTGQPFGAVKHPSLYAATALEAELDRVLAARPGSRNHTLNQAAFALGRLAATGFLPAGLAGEALTQAANAIGLPAGEAAATIRSGLIAGARHPRELAARTGS